ncbi:MAG TPA: zinc ribbon domain-containing protein [Pyrinomonadaceae bacterium]|nr:zinc ribbon domain-containing protein [Pyrinomonadaceae bacterium]
MFCPKCATQNLDGASFCRSCGANISLVPQALTGQLAPPQPPMIEAEGGCRTRRGRELTLEQPFKNFFLGIAFIIISIVLSRTIGQGWWFWLLIPAFMMMATGLAQFIRLQEHAKRASLGAPPVGRSFAEPPARTSELRAPVTSVTEGTTRHLGVEAPTRHLDHERH